MICQDCWQLTPDRQPFDFQLAVIHSSNAEKPLGNRPFGNIFSLMNVAQLTIGNCQTCQNPVRFPKFLKG